METFICSICHQPQEGYGNNAEPVNSGRCCNSCNISVVISERINSFNKLYQASIDNEEIRNVEIKPSKEFMIKRFTSVIGTLQSLLDIAIESEDFESAIRLRDRIQQKEEELNNFKQTIS